MEEDIKILETQIQACKECKFATCEQCEISYTEVKTIENLIARNEELEENKKELQEYIKRYLIPKSTINLIYIPKSKVKEKIEYLENNCGSSIAIGILQELLEGDK